MRLLGPPHSSLSPIAASLSKVPTVSTLLIAVCLLVASSAECQSNNCVPTWGELQQKIDALEEQKDAVSNALRREAYTIFDSSYLGLNKATDASLGSLLMKSGDMDAIQQEISEAKAASKKAAYAMRDAELANRSGQKNVEAAKMLEAAVAEAQAEWGFRKAFKTTAEIFARASGDLDPLDLAKRFWESRQDVADALKDLSLTGEAMELHKGLITATGELNSQIDNLRKQQPHAPYTRSASQQATCAPKSLKADAEAESSARDKQNKALLDALNKATAASNACYNQELVPCQQSCLGLPLDEENACLGKCGHMCDSQKAAWEKAFSAWVNHP